MINNKFSFKPLAQISIWASLYLELQTDYLLHFKTFPNRNLGKSRTLIFIKKYAFI